MDSQKSARISWGRIVVAGVLAEVTLFVIVFAFLYAVGRQAFLVSIVVGSALMPFLFALWVGRYASANFVLQGGLVGAVAILFYVIVSRARPEPTLYLISHGLKIVGGGAGGLVSAVRSRPVRAGAQTE